jgi:hypothetical protein
MRKHNYHRTIIDVPSLDIHHFLLHYPSFSKKKKKDLSITAIKANAVSQIVRRFSTLHSHPVCMTQT